jgi:hypothetical protein
MEEFNERDLFAGLAMVGLIIRTPSGEWSDDYVASSAYEIADAMLKTREHQDPEEGIAAIPTRKR